MTIFDKDQGVVQGQACENTGHFYTLQMIQASWEYVLRRFFFRNGKAVVPDGRQQEKATVGR